jgi:Cu(I)/Ag(I) efflux system membrane fusion protein
VKLRSPRDGFVLHRGVFEGHYVTPADELFTVADLNRVWVLADIFESDVSLITEGQKATLTLPYHPGRAYETRISYVYPFLESASRTAKIRFELENSNLELKPNMYVNVELQIEAGTRLAINKSAVLDTGTRKIAFVAMSGGRFEPRLLTLGEKIGDYWAVLDGVAQGELVVTSANFLIDSESKIRAALHQMASGHQH